MLREQRGNYLMINAVSRRVRQLQLGERAQATLPDGSRDSVRIAMQEFIDEKLEIVPRTPGQALVRMGDQDLESDYAETETDFTADDEDEDDEL